MQDPTTGQLYGEVEGQQIHEDTGNVPYLFAPISQAVQASTVVVAGVSGKKIRVLGFYLNNPNAANSATFQTQTGPTGLTGAMGIAQNGSIPLLPVMPHGCFETNIGDGLYMTLANATAVGGFLIYCLH